MEIVDENFALIENGFLVEVRKAAAVSRANLINTAFVVFAEKLARRFFIDDVAVGIMRQPARVKLILADSEMCRDSLDIALRVGGRHGLAAICTI